MNMKSLLEIKKILYTDCVEVVTDKIERAQSGMKAAQDAANNEGKSSMGDKYETGRAMMHLEKDKRAMQLVEVAKMKKALDMILPTKELSSIELGGLIVTNSANYFLSVSLGLLTVEGTEYFAISPATPIGKLILGLTKGDTFTFNGKRIIIEECV